MLNEICRELRNWFVVDDTDKHFGTFVVKEGEISPLDYVQNGQYYRIIGSVFNDGIYKAGEDNGLITEVFNGAVWAMRIPHEVIQLSEEISEWMKKNGDAVTSPYTSESFGGYSYTKATTASGNAISWQSAFADRLNRWRKI